MATAAAKAVWGDSKQNGTEPISGQTGDTSKGEPYDAGNIGNDHSHIYHTVSCILKTTNEIEDPEAQAAKAETNGTTEHTKDAEFAKQTGTAAEAEDTPDNPSTNLKSKSGPEDSTKAQNDVRDPENPQTNPKSAPTDVNDTEDGPNEAQKLDGPGPKPLDEVARENGGDAGNLDKDKSSKSLPGENPDASENKEEEDEDGPNAKSKGEGTGEQYVKSSGLQADGGDFDATKPGAGREADRLLEEKGVHHSGANVNGNSKADDDKSDKKEKKSIGQKIKDKLHRH
ncbi:hypothetical protein F5Y04DRAFT_275818 [Hypomontagnella monticulosa]|nr:hypothetical protein F5Y04DRAFT_275818 [Hypomontagnella monticulosa]